MAACSFEIVSNRLGLYQLVCHRVKGKRLFVVYIYNCLQSHSFHRHCQVSSRVLVLYGIKRIWVFGLMISILKQELFIYIAVWSSIGFEMDLTQLKYISLLLLINSFIYQVDHIGFYILWLQGKDVSNQIDKLRIPSHGYPCQIEYIYIYIYI